MKDELNGKIMNEYCGQPLILLSSKMVIWKRIKNIDVGKEIVIEKTPGNFQSYENIVLSQ